MMRVTLKSCRTTRKTCNLLSLFCVKRSCQPNAARFSCGFHKAEEEMQTGCVSRRNYLPDSARISAAAHEVDDLQMVAVAQLGVFPLRPRHDLAIQFDRHAIALHPKLLDE